MARIGIVDLTPSDHHDIMIAPYLNALTDSGATCFVLHWTEDPEKISGYISDCDGFLFPGGNDVDPALYGEDRIPECGDPREDRDRFEMTLLQSAVSSGKPILGICRGFQIMNVFFGGTLWQDIPSQMSDAVPHPLTEFNQIPVRRHSVRITPGTHLAGILGPGSLFINSAHHQGVNRLASGLTPCAVAEDGLIEAFEKQDHPFCLAVQWHPEWLWPEEDSRKLFHSFTEACRRDIT